MRRSLFICLVSLFVAAAAFADTELWKLDPPHSAAQFAVRHLGISTVRGAFSKVTGNVHYDPADVTKSSLDVSIDTASVDSRVERRDNDLRSDHFLDVQKYPTMTFKSKSIEKAGSGKLKMTGDLTLHGVTKEVVLDVDGPSEPMKDPKGNMHMGASASTKINRMDYGINGYQGAVGNEITITIDVELVKDQPAKP